MRSVAALGLSKAVFSAAGARVCETVGRGGRDVLRPFFETGSFFIASPARHAAVLLTLTESRHQMWSCVKLEHSAIGLRPAGAPATAAALGVASACAAPGDGTMSGARIASRSKSAS